MAKVVLSVIDGTPLKLNNDFSNFEFDIDGFMVKFEYKGTLYKYHNKNSFKSSHAGTSRLSRYYNEKKYLDYIQDLNGVDIYEILKLENQFDFKKYIAPLDEPIEVEYLDFSSPYLYYYKKKKATFKVGFNQKYKNILKQELILPQTAIISNFEVNLNDNPRGKFFNKNLAFINFWDTTSDENKKIFARVTTLIAFQIRTIVAEIFPKILSGNEMVFVDETRTRDNLNLDHLNLLQQIVFSLKKSWGYYFDGASSKPHQNDFEAILPIDPIIEPFTEYYNAVTSFYKTTYKIQDLLLNKSEEERIYYLLDVLSATAVRVLPYELRLRLLKWLLKRDVDETIEVKILKIVFSITSDEADNFLDFLLSKENGVNTLFEIIFQNMDDKRLYRYPVVSWFENEENNKMYFVKAVYELWRVSKYPFIKPDDTVNTQSYFLNEGSFYCFNAGGDLIERIFEYGAVKTNSTPQTDQTTLVETVYQDYKSDGKLEGVLINFNKFVNHNFIYTTQGGGAFDSQKDYEEPKKLIKHHLYQSLTLYGFSALDIDLIPNGSSIPAFLLYYTNDYKRLQRIDAAYSLATEVGIEVVLFFAFGGAAALRHLRHLKHITKLHKAINGTLAAEETVLVWRGLEATSEVISLKASLFMSLSSYNAAIATTDAERKRQQKISQVFLWITLAFAGGSILFRRKAVKAADELIDEIDALPPGTTHNIPADVIAVLRKLKNDGDTALTFFRNELNALDIAFEDIIRLVSRYDQFTLELKRAFYKDFKGMPKSFWAKISEKTEYLDNWESLFQMSIRDRLVLDVITKNSRVAAITRYYTEIDLRNVLEPLSFSERWRFLDKYGRIENFSQVRFNKCVLQPKKLELLLESGSDLKRGHLDELLDEDILKIIEADLSNAHIDLLRIKNKNNLGQIVLNFEKEITNVNINLNRLRGLRDGTGFSFMENLILTPKQIRNFKSVNKLVVETKVYNGNNLTSIFNEVYIAGWKSSIEDIFGGTLPSQIVEPTYNPNFNVFKEKAIDIIKNESKANDTELKYVFNFLEQHWNTGNRFDIVMESTYYSCQSCQGYMLYLKQLAKQEGKTLNLTIKSIRDAGDYKTLDTILNN